MIGPSPCLQPLPRGPTDTCPSPKSLGLWDWDEQEARKDAHLSDQPHVGDVVQTEPRAGAQISFNSGSVVTPGQRRVHRWLRGGLHPGRVQSGHVNFSTGDEATEIVTPTLRTTASQNAAGNIDVAESGETGV